MRFRLIYISVILLLLSFHDLNGQVECKQLLLNYLDEMSVPDIPDEGKVYYLQAQYQYDFYEKYGIKDFNSEVEVYMSKDQAIYETPQISYFNDSNDLFVIYHTMDRIIWSKGVQNPKASLQKIDILQIQKQLVESGTITFCKKVRINRKKYKKIELVFNKELQKETHVVKMSFLYDLKKKVLREIWAYFTDDQKLRSQKITINKIDFDYKGWYPVPVKELIFDKNGNLNSRFSHYHIINNKN